MKPIQEMAREAGFQWDLIDEGEGQIWYITQAGLEAFAKLVREEAIANEREACAKVCDDRAFRFFSESPFFVEMHGLADAIREREQA